VASPKRPHSAIGATSSAEAAIIASARAAGPGGAGEGAGEGPMSRRAGVGAWGICGRGTLRSVSAAQRPQLSLIGGLGGRG